MAASDPLMKMKVVIKDGRANNLYEIEKCGGKFVVRKVSGGILPFTFDSHKIGSANLFEDAVAIVKGHAGTSRIEIKSA
jgi:hypothetical protein